MDNKPALWSVLLLLSLLLSITTAEDSLRSALNAVNRRQRDLGELSKYGDYYNNGYDDNDELYFLGPSNNYGTGNESPILIEKALKVISHS